MDNTLQNTGLWLREEFEAMLSSLNEMITFQLMSSVIIWHRRFIKQN